MSQTISKALWIGAAIAAVVIATGILWPIIRSVFNDSDNQRPTFPTSHGPIQMYEINPNNMGDIV